jgi:hypothetical protein
LAAWLANRAPRAQSGEAATGAEMDSGMEGAKEWLDLTPDRKP